MTASDRHFKFEGCRYLNFTTYLRLKISIFFFLADMEQQASPAAAEAKIHPEWSLWPLDGDKYSLSVYQCFVFILLISKMKHEVPSPKQKNN